MYKRFNVTMYNFKRKEPEGAGDVDDGYEEIIEIPDLE